MEPCISIIPRACYTIGVGMGKGPKYVFLVVARVLGISYF